MPRRPSSDQRCLYRAELKGLDRSNLIYISRKTLGDPDFSLTNALYRQPDGVMKLHVIVESPYRDRDPNFIETLHQGAEVDFFWDELQATQITGAPN